MAELVFPAHIRVEGENKTIQSVEAHCHGVAERAAASLQGVGLAQTGYLMGLTHDCGKRTELFSDYIQRASNGEAVRRGSVNHTFAAVKLFLSRYHGESRDVFEKLTAELLAYAVGAHHGLFDCDGPDRKNGFEHRLEKEEALYAEASENFFRCCGPQELDRRFSDACAELRPIVEHLIELVQGREANAEELGFSFGCLARLLLSALIDGDRTDTAEFMCGEAPVANPRMTPDRWRECLARVERKLNGLKQDSAVNRARARLSQSCRSCAGLGDGIYRLNLPTGSGKTLGSLRFALAHAVEREKRHLIFVSPLLSILEQNAKVIREYLQDDSLILEHHSNVIRVEEKGEALSPVELYRENWDAPVIITTLVQLLNTLFSGEMTAIRRFHSLCGSVIVIDEIQTVPLKLLSMFQLAMSFLAEVCGATVILCSATQPAQEATAHPFYKEPEDLVPYDAAVWAVFRRTQLQEAGSFPLREIPAFVQGELERCDSLLLICNKKDEAGFLFEAIRDASLDCFHLSASMCSAHRRETLAAMEASSRARRKKTVCISTQVMEAGVDQSFGRVIRLTAGMDNVVQAAGRCNRNGESRTPVPVYILNCTDEDLSHLPEIQQARNATTALLAEYRKNAEAFENDLSSDSAIRTYYKFLYRSLAKGAMDYPAGEHGTLLDLLASNKKYATEFTAYYGKYFLCQAFKTAGQLFSVFDSQTQTLLVPYGKGAEIIQQMRALGDRYDPEALREMQQLLERAKPYAVSVYAWQLEQLKKQGVIDCICHESVLVLQADCFGDLPYSEETGLKTGKG